MGLDGTPGIYTMASYPTGHAQCFLSGVSGHTMFGYVMFIVSVQAGALGARHPGGLSMRWEPGCTYTQGKGYLMYMNAPRTYWALTLVTICACCS